MTDICVISNCIMIKSALPEALIEVDTKGCASFDENLEKAALTVLEKSLQVKVISVIFLFSINYINCFVLFPHFVLHLANDSTIMRTILKGDFNNGNQSRKSKDS